MPGWQVTRPICSPMGQGPERWVTDSSAGVEWAPLVLEPSLSCLAPLGHVHVPALKTVTGTVGLLRIREKIFIVFMIPRKVCETFFIKQEER